MSILTVPDVDQSFIFLKKVESLSIPNEDLSETFGKVIIKQDKF